MADVLDPLTSSPLGRIRSLIFNASEVVSNSFGVSSTTQEVGLAEVAPARTPVSETQIMFGPSSVDEDLVAQLDALRQQGFPPLPGAAAFDD